MRKAELFWLAFGLGLLSFGAFFWTRATVRCERPGSATAECRVTTARWFGTVPAPPILVPGVTEAASVAVERSRTSSNQPQPSYRLVLRTKAGPAEVVTSYRGAIDAAVTDLQGLLRHSEPGVAEASVWVWLPGFFAMVPGFLFTAFGVSRIRARLRGQDPDAKPHRSRCGRKA